MNKVLFALIIFMLISCKQSIVQKNTTYLIKDQDTLYNCISRFINSDTLDVLCLSEKGDTLLFEKYNSDYSYFK